MIKNLLSGIFIVWCCAISTGLCQNPAKNGTFRNPLLPTGPDPWVIQKNGYYYYCNTTGVNITLWKTKNLADLASAEKHVVWTPPAGEVYSRELWAPELHFLQGKWYIYVAADDGKNDNHRVWVLENSDAEPTTSNWTLKGKITDPTDRWAIDMSVFEMNKKLYVVWSGWDGAENVSQNIYIAQLKNPWTIEGARTKIASPVYDWEKVGASNSLPVVNEGPQFLRQSPKSKKVFIVFSASGCWADGYKLGLLEARADADLMQASSWKKFPEPVFVANPDGEAFAPGHNSFFQSPDGKEHWIIYHANPKPNQGCGKFRSPRMQPFTWKADGTPDFGKPIALQQEINLPSGQK
ncbi:glycoside hydrolase family 43 protein [Emticicia sp. 17c]|uniref:glycoside hydrolase family 43 protein n=1 Tax=Emticicia sp. 17c TaxID=3127704 RepID=UPI00301CC0DB